MRRAGVIALAALLGCAHEGYEWRHYAASLDLELASGGRFDGDAVRGHATLVTFFATWCVPCVAELPWLKQTFADYQPRGLSMLAVGMDLEGAAVLAPFAQAYRLPFPVLVADAPMREGRSPFGAIHALPTTFILGKDGHVVAAFEGIAAAPQVREMIERAVRE